jgi:hypothetical protein
MHVCFPYIKLAITICFSSLVKAYVQQPEGSKLKLAQLEQELQKSHQQVTLSWLHVCLLSAWKIVLCAVIFYSL